SSRSASSWHRCALAGSACGVSRTSATTSTGSRSRPADHPQPPRPHAGPASGCAWRSAHTEVSTVDSHPSNGVAGPGSRIARALPPPTAADHGGLTPEDQRHLADMERRLQVVRDYTVGVVAGFYTGLYVYGPGGTSKSYTILGVLRERHAAYVLHNS